MKIVIVKDSKGGSYQKTESGTCYHIDTPAPVIERLEYAGAHNQRIRLFLGDPKTGEDWNEDHNVTGRVGRSNGWIPIPILLYNRRSIGGGAILDHCIVKIMVGRRVVYQHPRYQCSSFWTIGRLVYKDSIVVATFKTARRATKYVEFMRGGRHNQGGK